ncbi:glycoside hydrolase family 2 TIM barrel-domain containing protein [Clostridium boliviensis]|uniref:Glycoside hydrolase family 2 TIM barrel-domain containing protein n=1 Tax=Clostridium boliviensis TaxID=318465 RepID=A0ABU4GNP7_9CLOT|nr:glycoside hydrolase family 2 TIM barrel-domain containing protein [Clostridium boliviensis]MDW2799223.1 glycoside hydrolase family 2 TIM barrel-domain containing protein [Clostridium boliviensis]
MIKENVPRPDFRRDEWVSLNGEWDFSFDEPLFDKKIKVPFCYQSEMSGIGTAEVHHIVWYLKEFVVEKDRLSGKSLLLKFGAVDYEAEVYVNQTYAAGHRGGHTPFEADITGLVTEGKNIVTVKVMDYSDADKPRGKQTWTGENFACWYTPTTGIWQSVWLEYAGKSYIKRIKATPDLDRNEVLCEVFVSSMKALKTEISFRSIPAGGDMQKDLGSINIICENGYGKGILALPDLDVRREELIWTLAKPNLIEMQALLLNDQVYSYFGLRSVSVSNGRILLNGEVLYQRLILDQGYWKESLLTPPDEEAIKEDIILAKKMGFNGARKHQKVEDPRYYYWADRLGFLVWGEMPSCFQYTDNTLERTSGELTEFIQRDYNHPSIITWVTANESWGMRNIRTDKSQQNFSNMLYYQAKALDKTRLVSGNDGWEQTEHTDILALHDYELMPENTGKYDCMEEIIYGLAERRMVLAEGQKYGGQPVLMTEYGGIAFSSDETGWGYYNKAGSLEEFMNRLEPVTDSLIKSRKFSGFCYTQLTDVMQETNGLLKEDRTPKVPLELLERIFGKKYYE